VSMKHVTVLRPLVDHGKVEHREHSCVLGEADEMNEIKSIFPATTLLYLGGLEGKHEEKAKKEIRTRF
jgi:hypothetical protein